VTAQSTLPSLDDAGRALLFSEGRTANSFAPTPVSDEELRSIWELAKWGPSSANIQPLRVLYVRTPEGRDRVVKHMADFNAVKTATAPAVAVLAWDTQYHDFIPSLVPYRPEMREMFAANDELRIGSGNFNAALQAGYFLISIRAHGLAAGPMAGFDRDGMDAEFFADGRWKSLLVVNIGHPGENPWFDRLPRLNHDDVIQWA
jgi:3-hydroxypropanoate dehydrogenase